MRSLKDYISEQLNNNQPINEMFLTCLVGLAMASLGIKLVKGIGNGVAACWNAVLGDQLSRIDSSLETINNDIITEKKQKISSKNLFVLQVPDENTLKQVINKTKPQEGVTTDKGHGLWTLAKKLGENKELLKVNNGDIKPQYAAIIKKKTNDIVGMFGFSIDYWDAVAKSNAKNKKLAKQFNKYIHIIDIDICPEYEIDSIDEFVWDTIFKVQKELKTKGITIWADDDNEKQEYRDKGFDTVKGHNNIMFVNNKDYKETE